MLRKITKISRSRRNFHDTGESGELATITLECGHVYTAKVTPSYEKVLQTRKRMKCMECQVEVQRCIADNIQI